MNLTREQILKLEGRELDAAVAQHVMGWKPETNLDGFVSDKLPRFCIYKEQCLHCEPYHDRHAPRATPYAMQWGKWKPSTDIAAAWLVVEKVRERKKFFVCIESFVSFSSEGWVVNFGGRSAKCETAPLAICRAALLAMLEDGK